eukprot:TRINITY_DN1156_c0_g1_i1.p1 TRINITY_DN1156_c0_g1~~TRINITY_DN1156_c0_g1_i1.p1  ORF type:complete len:144 (-),score=39.07 TRINITY_DN1156_c0_g1_i1:17-424(-)
MPAKKKIPPVSKLIFEAINFKNNPFRGASRSFIHKYIKDNYGPAVDTPKFLSAFRISFKRMIDKKDIIKSDAGDYYRLAPKKPAKKAAKSKSKKSTKTTSKRKPVAKKAKAKPKAKSTPKARKGKTSKAKTTKGK